MAKVKVINNNLDQNLNGTNFNDTPSKTIFSFGSFTVTSNFDGKANVNYTNTLSSFVRPVTLETMGVTDVQSQILQLYSTNAVLNLDKSDLNTFVRYGSAYEFLRVTIQNIILAYPGSLFANSQWKQGGNETYNDFEYNSVTNISTFYVPTGYTVNTFGLVINNGNTSVPDNKELKNLNNSFSSYVVSTSLEPDKSYSVVGYTGNTVNSSDYIQKNYLKLQVIGNPFALYGTGVTGSLDFHIKPNNVIFEEFRALLNPYEKYIISQREGTTGFKFKLKDPTLLDDGTIVYSDSSLLWSTGDGYNVDVNTPNYQKFLQILLTVGAKYDKIKTDLIARFLTPASLKTYDYTEDGKIPKLLRIYGREFDQIRQFIDSLVHINKVTYNKINNIPDQLIKNMSRTFGWDYFSLVNEGELVNTFLTIDDSERNLNEDILPAEIDVELWRRILNNTNYFWKSKGTRQAIKSMFLLIGIPEPFINITEYVYTVDGKIDPRQVSLSLEDFPNSSLPYYNDNTSSDYGYPKAPAESPTFYFQISGDTDSGQAYMNNFRNAGFNLQRTVDNKKSWEQTGSTMRTHYSTPQYYQEDSMLVINTKEVDISLDTARGIEYDVYRYIKYQDFTANSSGYTLPYSYVNISLAYTGMQNTFTLPTPYNKTEGDLEVRYNGILLNAPKTGSTSGVTTNADYTVTGNTFTILNGNYAQNSGNRRDVIQATFIYSGATALAKTGITVSYVVTRVNAQLPYTYIQLPSYPRGDVQLTINGIALTKGTPQFTADYIVDPNNTSGNSRIIIQNPEVISFLAANPEIQVAYVDVTGSDDINARSEVVRVDSFNTSKIYFNPSANKYVYKLNYKANSAKEVKFMIDGIALEPFMDYNVNVMNPYEIFLPKGIRYGSVISVYYLVGGNAVFAPVIGDNFGIGDISKLSFLEFLELVQKRMINAKNRKTISNSNGGWYPTVLKIYEMYLQRSLLPNNDPLHSNGYTFENLYPFLSKYNAFFQRFVDQLLSTTIILSKSGLLVRNTVFTKQKFAYKRGVNVPSGNTMTKDLRGNPLIRYYGNDGSQFLIDQNIYPPVPPSAVIPTVATNTISGIAQTTAMVSGTITSDGGSPVTSRGIAWSTSPNPTIGGDKTVNGAGTGAFIGTLTPLTPSTVYHVRAYAINAVGIAYGEDKEFTTAAEVISPSLLTRAASNATQTTIENTGGVNIAPAGIWTSIDFYYMIYKKAADSAWLSTPSLAGPLAVNNFTTTITGLEANTEYHYQAHLVIAGVEYVGDVKAITTAAIIPALPTVTTDAITSILQTSAVGGGNVTSEGTSPVTSRGIVWSLAPNPTTANNVVTSGSGSGAFSGCAIVGLSTNTTYHVRAFATSSVGTVYGNEVTFTTAMPTTLHFNGVSGGVAGITASQFAIGQILSIDFTYYLDAACDMIGITGSNSSTTTIEYTLDNVNWILLDSVQAYCESFSDTDDAGDSQNKNGVLNIPNVTISNINNIKFRGSYECSQNRDGKSGFFEVVISVATVNTGVVVITCNDRFSGGCANSELVDCTL